MIYDNMKKSFKASWCACDTETYTLIDGQKITTEELNKLALQSEHTTAWFREHATIDTYAWQISCGEHNSICNNFIEWLEKLCLHNIKVAWFYNAKFDFSQIDYAILTNNTFKPYNKENKDAGFNMYQSLHSNYGARYSYTIWFKHENKNHKKVYHKIVIYDLMNIFTGGLAKLLKDLDIRDANGNELRKLEMDYQTNTDENGNYTQEAINYMIMDVKGLYYVVQKCHDYIKEKYNMNLIPKPDFMTAGGFAKRLLLETLYNKGNYKENIQAFQKQYFMWLSLDIMFRTSGLYQGGKCIVNYKYQNQLINKPFARYDYNSHYPARMRESIALKGSCYHMDYDEYIKTYNNEKYVYILHIKKLRGYLKNGMIGVWYDYKYKKYTDSPIIDETNQLLIFEFEFNEYKNYYDFDYEIDYVYAYEKQYDYNYQKYVDMVYAEKNEGKKTKNKVKEMFSKLGLNSAYGKFAQNPYNAVCHYEINADTGAVHLVTDGVEADEKSLMSVVQGALITARGRTELCKAIREYSITCPANDFYYCDTDSIHGNFNVTADPYKIGELKLEANCKHGLFLAPKTYFEIDDNDIIEVHSKGVRPQQILNVLKRYNYIDKDNKVLDLKGVCNVFKAGNKFQVLCAMNLKGGKGLIPLFKELCCIDNTRIDDIDTSYDNMNGDIELYEI